MTIFLQWGLLADQWSRICLPMQEMQVWSLGQEDSLEKEMATHSSILAWRIPWTEEPGGLQSMGSQRVRHDWTTNTHTHTHRHTHTHTHTLWSRNPTPGYLFKRNDNLSRAEVAQKTCIGLPCWLGGEESTCQCRRHRFDSWSRRTPHAVKQLSPCATTTEPGLESQEATTTEPMCLDRVCALQPEKPPQRETHSLQPEKGLCSNKDPMQPKINT